ncbi:MAG: cache domain-containing protein [Chloroflexota bacterium]
MIQSRGSLRTRFFLTLLLIGILPLSLVGFVIVSLNSRALMEQSERELMGLASGLAGEIDAYLFGLLNDAKVIAALPDVVSMDPERQEPLLQELFQLNYGFAQIVTTDRTGQMLASARPMSLRSIGHVQSFQRALNGIDQSWVVDSAVFGEGLDLHIHTPIYQDDGQIVGVVGSPVPISSMAGAVERVSGGIQGESFVLDENGVVLFHPYLTDVVQELSYADWVYRSDGTPPLSPGVARYELDGVERVAGYAPLLNRFGWTVIVERPLAEIAAAADRSRNLALLGLGASTLLSIIAASYLSRILARPVADLAEASLALGSGDATVPLPEQTAVREIDTLVNSFTEMRAAVVERENRILRHMTAMQALSDGMAILDVEQQFIFVNRAYAHMHGYRDPSWFNGRSWQTFYAPTAVSQLNNSILPRVQAAQEWRGELLAQKRDGSTFDQEASLTQVETGEYVLVVRDVTRRKASEEVLRRVQKLESLGVLTGGIAHDFNNLLTGMLGHATIAKSKLTPDTIIYEHVSNAVVAAERASDLTHQLLAYTGKAQFEMSPLDLNKLVLDNVRLLETAVPRQTELVLDLQPNLPLIRADKSQMQQVLMNLVINAAEATESTGGHVTVKTGEEIVNGTFPLDSLYLGGETLVPGPYICLKVTDTGMGMSEETLERIFDPFFSTKPKGYGLGLSATLGIIRTHKGGLRVTSATDSGTEFVIYVPMTTERLFSQTENDRRGPPLTGTILVIDDEEAVRRVTSDILTDMGMRVLTAVNGRQGVEMYQQYQNEISVVLLDLKMPVMDGHEAYQALLKMDPSVNVILSSGYSEGEVGDYFVSETAVTFLQKPYSYERLIAKVRETIFTNPSSYTA